MAHSRADSWLSACTPHESTHGSVWLSDVSPSREHMCDMPGSPVTETSFSLALHSGGDSRFIFTKHIKSSESHTLINYNFEMQAHK